MRNTSCFIPYPAGQDRCEVPVTENLSAEVKHADALAEVPIEKLNAMKKYAADLHRKHPTMKQERVMRKTADYFKVKLT